MMYNIRARTRYQRILLASTDYACYVTLLCILLARLARRSVQTYSTYPPVPDFSPRPEQAKGEVSHKPYLFGVFNYVLPLFSCDVWVIVPVNNT